MRVRIRALGVEHSDRAGFQRRINGKDAHLLLFPATELAQI
jgi:hypothetical protein